MEAVRDKKHPESEKESILSIYAKARKLTKEKRLTGIVVLLCPAKERKVHNEGSRLLEDMEDGYRYRRHENNLTNKEDLMNFYYQEFKKKHPTKNH